MNKEQINDIPLTNNHQQLLMEKIAERYVTMSGQTKDEYGYTFLLQGENLSLGFSDFGSKNNVLSVVNQAIGEDPKMVEIGHFDPAIGGFVYYPELVSGEDTEVLDETALDLRNQANNEERKLDFDSEVVVNLRKKHRSILEKNDLIGKIVERANAIHTTDPDRIIGFEDDLYIDDHTSYNLVLMPKLGGFRYIGMPTFSKDDTFLIDDAFASIELNGAYNVKNGVKVRNSCTYINIANLDFDRQDGIYLPNTDLVKPKEFAPIQNAAAHMRALRATSQPNLDTAHVALKVGK